jgi:hypothetical protein
MSDVRRFSARTGWAGVSEWYEWTWPHEVCKVERFGGSARRVPTRIRRLIAGGDRDDFSLAVCILPNHHGVGAFHGCILYAQATVPWSMRSVCEQACSEPHAERLDLVGCLPRCTLQW